MQNFNKDKMFTSMPMEYITADIDDFKEHNEAFETWNKIDNLFFYGDTGTGKTRAMYALMIDCWRSGYAVEIVEFASLCSRIRATYESKGNETEDSIIKSLSNLDVLFIDDLGLQQNVSDFAYITFYRIINTRNANGLATVISSNKTIEQIAISYDKRIASRLNTYNVIEFKGKDWRVVK